MVHWLISKKKIARIPNEKLYHPTHYLKILIKSTKHSLSYCLKHDRKSISKITFVPGFVLALLIQNFDSFSQKLLFVIQISNILA